MVVNTTFVTSRKPRVVSIGPRQRPAVVNVPDEAMRHEQAMEYRSRNQELSVRLKSANLELDESRKEVERLGVEIKRLHGEIERLNAINVELARKLNAEKPADASAPKYKRRRNKDQQPETPVEQPVTENVTENKE